MPTVPSISNLKERLRAQQEKARATAKELAAAIRAEQGKKHAALGELFEIIYQASDNDTKSRYRVTLATSKLSQTKKTLISSIFDDYDAPKKKGEDTKEQAPKSEKHSEAKSDAKKEQ